MKKKKTGNIFILFNKNDNKKNNGKHRNEYNNCL